MAAILKSRSPSLGTISTTSSIASTMIDVPIPSISITNKPSNGTSLYHQCRSVLDRLALVEGMTCYLEFETSGSTESIANNNSSNDPLTKLWELCRRGTPLATLFNALDPKEPLKLDFTVAQAQQQMNECKKSVYHFIVACRNQLDFKEQDVFTLSDLYKDNTNGFVKVVNTIDMILQLLEEKGIISSVCLEANAANTPKDTRDKVVHELLETERKYVQDLEILQNYMRELQIQEVLNPDTIHYLFGNLNSLADFQRRFLIQLEEIGEKTPEEQNFGLLFTCSEDQFAVYEPYCANYFSAQDLVVQEAPKLQKLAGILNPVYELPSMLIKPVQRICKYPLLVQQLIKSTNNDWPHISDMEQGLESIRRVTEKVNETQRKYENIKVVEELKRRVDEMRPTQIDSFGTLLLHDKLILQQSEDKDDKEMYIYFFERTMLICKESKDATKNKLTKSTSISIKKKRRASLQPKGLIIISRILSVKNKSTGEGNWLLAIDWKDKEVDQMVLKFRNEEQVKLWESTLRNKMSPMKTTVSNTQLASMKSTYPISVPAAFKTDDDDENENQEDENAAITTTTSTQRSRSNSFSAHLFNSIHNSSGKNYNNSNNNNRPNMSRNTSSPNTGAPVNNNLPVSRTSASANTQDYYSYPASPPPSTPSSPTTSSRVSQSSTSSSSHRRDTSPLADIASKFMSAGLSTPDSEDYRPPHMNRSQSHSAASPGYPSTSHQAGNISPSRLYHQQQQQQQQQQQHRVRSQSSPNIHHNNQQGKWEDLPQLPGTPITAAPINSRTLYQQTPPSPLDSPTTTTGGYHRSPSNSRLSDLSNQPPNSPTMQGALKLKLNYNDGIYVVMCSAEILFHELQEKVERKVRLIANHLQVNDVLRLKYQDEDGDLITINSDEDVQMAFENRNHLNTINLFVSF